MSLSSFFFHVTAPPEIYTLSLHDALPISRRAARARPRRGRASTPAPWPRAARAPRPRTPRAARGQDRKSTRLNSSHLGISYAVFCLKKKKKNKQAQRVRTRQDRHSLDARA